MHISISIRIWLEIIILNSITENISTSIKSHNKIQYPPLILLLFNLLKTNVWIPPYLLKPISKIKILTCDDKTSPIKVKRRGRILTIMPLFKLTWKWCPILFSQQKIKHICGNSNDAISLILLLRDEGLGWLVWYHKSPLGIPTLYIWGPPTSTNATGKQELMYLDLYYPLGELNGVPSS